MALSIGLGHIGKISSPALTNATSVNTCYPKFNHFCNYDMYVCMLQDVVQILNLLFLLLCSFNVWYPTLFWGYQV